MERRFQAANIAAAVETSENDSLLVVDPEMGTVPEPTIQVANQNMDEINALKARMSAMETFEARRQAIEQGKS